MYATHPISLPEPPRAATQPVDQLSLMETIRFRLLVSPDRLLSVRPVTPADTTLLADLIARLSDTARRRRFFRPLPSSEAIWQEASRVAQRDPRLGVALMATVSEGDQECAVALAELVQNPAMPTAGELAVLVRDDLQRQRVGTRLMRLLIVVARWRGVQTLHATLQADNRAAHQLLHKLGLAFHSQVRQGEITTWAELR